MGSSEDEGVAWAGSDTTTAGIDNSAAAVPDPAVTTTATLGIDFLESVPAKEGEKPR